MAFALTSWVAYGTPIEGVKDRYHQHLVLKCTSTNTDVSLDFDEFAAGSLGTFWDAVDGSEPGDGALQAVRNIAPKVDCLIGLGGDTPVGNAQDTSAGSGVFVCEVAANHFPDILWSSGTAPTSGVYVLSWLLKEGQEPEVGSGEA